MKQNNILLLTAVYPADDLPKEYTPVVHYFAKEWVKLGYNVRVVNFEVDFPGLIMKVASWFSGILASYFGTVIRTKNIYDRDYEIDGVYVRRIVLKKYILHGPIPRKELEKGYNKTLDLCKNSDYIPDVVVSHWCNPQLEIMQRIKEKYRIKSCYVAHLPGDDILSIMSSKKAREIVDNIDIIGFRSDYIKNEFLARFPYNGKTFQCYSGVPDSFITNDINERSFENLNSFIYVGTFIKRKYPASIIPAVKRAMKEAPFTISYIGQGSEISNIEKQISKWNCEGNVNVLGRMKREDVVEQLKKHDIFVMISRQETFGLVYLEAMAVGCITIASKKEGFDGIIKHGVNGFLCEAGNEDELSLLIEHIRLLNKDELRTISRNAIATAKELTEAKVAKSYLDSIVS